MIGFSHQSVHIAPTNGHYGPRGDYRNCGVNSNRNASDVKRCLTATDLWRGEMFGNGALRVSEGEVAVRLTFNPLFDRLVIEIDRFVAETTRD